ncbi:MAG: ABC transporter ATP-binding protein [Lachnospiraceae bacterium]|nr:ABC transporter ATP-binding protein [Lachnospiraceae bacterium]
MKVVLDHLTKEFRGKGKESGHVVIAVNDFVLEIPDGKLVGLLGPSGCGKSTVLNLICGLLKPTSGRVFFGENDVTDLEPQQRGVGMVFQNYALYPHLNVEQNIVFPLENFRGADRLSKEEMHERAMETAKLVQIERLMERKPSELSGGQQQRVAIARALVKRPGILLLDEPLSNLDARLRLQTREEIRRIQQETGITTIFVTHDQEEAMSISDMIVVMRNGLLEQTGAPQEVYDDPGCLFVAQFLGTPPINVFDGSIRNGRLFIGDDDVLEAPGAIDASFAGGERPVSVAIRPEGFIPDPEGPFRCRLVRTEVMGRDISVLSVHPSAPDILIRSIISAENLPQIRETAAGSGIVSFRLKPAKTHVFGKEKEDRLF